MAGGVAGIMPGVERYAVPGQPLHEGHGRIAVEVGAVPLALLQDGEAAGGGAVALRPRGHAGGADQPVAAIDMDALPFQADDQVERPAGGGIIGPTIRPRRQRQVGQFRPRGRHAQDQTA